MDFDKLKKAARETFRMVSSKIEEKNDTPSQDSVESSESEDTIQNSSPEKTENTMEQTQRIDLKNVLDMFKKKKGSDNDFDADLGYAEDDENIVSDSAEEFHTPVSNIKLNELKSQLNSIDTALVSASETEKENYDSLKEIIDELAESVSELRAATAASDKQHIDLTDAIVARLNNTDKKLNSISNSLTGISKLSDSIFDLKNSQMNTKNSLGDLEASFYKLKKKLSSSVLIISILTAVIAILEIINLLS